MEMKTEGLIWAGVSVLILYLIWLVIKPVLSPIVIALALVYITYPLHDRLSRRIGWKKSAFVLSILLTLISTAFVIGFVLWMSDVKYQLIHYLDAFFSWLQSVTVSSQTVNEALSAVSEGIGTRLEGYIVSYTYSIPKMALEIFVMIFVYYGVLVNADAVVEEVYSLIPPQNRAFGTRLIDATKSALDTLLKSWLSLSIVKGMTAALGFWLFGVSNVSGSIALGVLVSLLELLPLLGGWMVWLPASVYLAHSSGPALGFLLGVYGFALISPLPDLMLAPRITVRKRGLNALISLIGIFGGLWAFGLVGIIVGPVALGLLSTVVEEWKTAMG